MAGQRFLAQSAIGGLYQQSAAALTTIGTFLHLDDGRSFVYGQVGASNIAAGALCQNILPAGANFDNLVVPTASAVGDRVVYLTLGGTAATENQFANGIYWVEDATLGGTGYKISGHPAQTSTTGLLTLTLKDPLWEAVSTSATPSVDYPLGYGVIIHPSTNTSALVGVTMRDMTAAYYGWFQRRGGAVCLTEGTLVIGDPCMPSASTDGAVAPCAAATDLQIGTVRKVAATTAYALVDLNLP